MFRAVVLAVGILGAPAFSQAQLPTLDINCQANGASAIDVVVRPNGDFEGVFSSLVFTLRWAAGTATLGEAEQIGLPAQYMPIASSGPVVESNGNNYQVFAGFGFIALADMGASWTANDEILLATIPVINGASSFAAVNDDWTGELQNNADFFVSLNGEDRTGALYGSPSYINAASTSPAWALRPNPAEGYTTLSAFGVPGATASLAIVDALGREVWLEEIMTLEGRAAHTLDLSKLESGTYLVRIQAGAYTSSTRLVVR
jgi:Secretion system C-terminal sorting domain